MTLPAPYRAFPEQTRAGQEGLPHNSQEHRGHLPRDHDIGEGEPPGIEIDLHTM